MTTGQKLGIGVAIFGTAIVITAVVISSMIRIQGTLRSKVNAGAAISRSTAIGGVLNMRDALA
jgi:hypothetical protein